MGRHGPTDGSGSRAPRRDRRRDRESSEAVGCPARDAGARAPRRAAGSIRHEAEAARRALQHDPAGRGGARRAGGAAVKRPPTACTPQAEDSFIYEGLIACCTTCASRMLARKSKRGADLRAPKGVRMVWWGFRALKTPERAFSLPTRSRVGLLTPRRGASAVQTVCNWTNTGQILDVCWTKTGHPPGLLTRDADA